MKVVHFIRHAQSESNAGLPTEHPATIRLTEKGLEQARLTSQIFQEAPDLIVTTPYIRTLASASSLIERFPGTRQVEWPAQEFTYLDPINWKGTTIDERGAAAHAYWQRNDPLYRDSGGAESFVDLMQRIDQVRQLIMQQDASQVVIYSHGLFIRSFWWRMCMPCQPVDAETMRNFIQFARGMPLPNCSILRFRFEDELVWVNGPQSTHLPAELITH